MKLIWSPLALERVAEIAEYIARDRPRAAEEWVEDIFAAVERLERFPLSGRTVREANRPDIREVLHGSFRIFYRVEEGQLSVLTVRHARQLTEPEDLGISLPPSPA
jgi:plasmid stabilization system protein ParE